MSTFFLSVPDSESTHQRERRKSDGCIVQAFVSNGLRSKEKFKRSRDNRDPSADKSTERDGKHKRFRLFPSQLDSNLIECLRRNYELVTALADIESPEDRPATPKKMKGPIPRIETDDSPRPLIIRQHNPCGSEDMPCSRWVWLKREIRFFLLDVVEALETPGETIPSNNVENSKLSAIALKRDLKRCYSALHPFIEVAAALYDLLLWKSPISTLLLTLVYFFSIIRGWTASLVLLLLLFQLSLNYLHSVKNIDIGLSFLPKKEVPLPRFDISGAQLIFDIAKVAQQLLRFSADFLEKLHNLLTWKEERVTWKFYYLVIYWLVLSMVFNTGTCLGMCGLALGIRIFVTTYLFDRFPRLRFRLDTFGWFYRNLPIKNPQSPVNGPKTDEERCITPGGASSRRSTICGEMFTSRLGSNFNLDKGGLIGTPTVSTDTETNIRLAECGSFSQNSLSDGRDEKDDSSTEEDPMIDNVVAFRSCVMNEKDKLFPKGISTGILYLTDAALIFRSRATNDERPIMFLFHDIVSVKKIQSLNSMSLIAGTRKGIEILVAGRRKPLQFIGMAQRDPFVSHMGEMCFKCQANTHFIVD
ncbi:unnamed protein product [Auanema sp. JU1783]|nr:unnamed protein product [Auanema sp. JU1783]